MCCFAEGFERPSDCPDGVFSIRHTDGGRNTSSGGDGRKTFPTAPRNKMNNRKMSANRVSCVITGQALKAGMTLTLFAFFLKNRESLKK